MKVTTFKAYDNPTIDDLEKIIKSKLGEKYTYKSSRKAASLGGKIVQGLSDKSASNSITVIKNAYHRTVVSLETIDDPSLETGKRTSIYFSEATLAGWLGLLHKEAGILGSLIIGLIYGKSDAIYKEVENLVKTNINGEDETFDVGLGSLFNKKK